MIEVMIQRFTEFNFSDMDTTIMQFAIPQLLHADASHKLYD